MGRTRLSLVCWVGIILAATSMSGDGTAFGQQARPDFEGPVARRTTNRIPVEASSVPASPTASAAAKYEALKEQAKQFALPLGHIREVIQVVQPSVVHIEAVKQSSAGEAIEEAGAGVIFSLDETPDRKFVMTNRHVVRDAPRDAIRLQLADGKFFCPSNVWLDAGSDLAVLELPAEELPACRFGSSKQLSVGDFVIAIGSPFGLRHSATYGIVSAKGRRNLQLGREGVRYQDFIQTDASINPGNSGGPLLNLAGEVVGINTAIASTTGSSEGVAFTIPIDMALKVARDLVSTGQVKRAFLGVSLDENFTPEMARQLGLPSVYGARVFAVTTGSPAEAARLQAGDIILRLNDRVIEDDSHLVQVVAMLPIDSRVELQVFRQGELLKLSTVLTDRSEFSSAR